MTMDAGSQSLFSRLISMGSSSLLQYVSESFPWSADPAHAALDVVQSVAHEERDEVVRLTRMLQKRHLPLPVIGAYPSHFTNINFVSLDYLLPKLCSEHEKEIAEIESKLYQVGDDDIREEVQGYLDMKRRHLQTLQGLTARKTPADAA
jgi:hypothetical protein